MVVFLDMGTNVFQGLQEFTHKKNLNNDTTVYCYEPNTYVFNHSLEMKQSIQHNYKQINHYNKAVMDYTGSIEFNSHHGVWDKDRYINDYTGGSNALVINPQFDSNNGVIFDIHKEVVECIDICEVITQLNLAHPEEDIYVKCDIEGSEFKVLPKLLAMPLESIKQIKEIYIEWHERFFEQEENYHDICKLKRDIIQKLSDLNIVYYEHH
jgi:FkbM family methyltransferase